MGGIWAVLAGDPEARQIAGPEAIGLLRRVVESLPQRRPGRYALYLGRPDPAMVRAEREAEAQLIRSARRAVVATPETTPLPPEAERRDPGLGWLAHLWFSAVLGEETGMALIGEATTGEPEQAWLLTEPAAVRRFIAAVEGELARPDPELLAV